MQPKDYAMLYAIAGAESAFKTGAQAGTSSAQGLFQFTTDTWKYLTTKMYPELKYKPNDRLDPVKSANVAAKYVSSIQDNLGKYLGTAPTLGQVYLGYFMGPTGARKFLGALAKNPNQIGAKLFPRQAKANKNLFYDKDKPLTLQQTLDKLSGRVSVYSAQAGAVSDGPVPMPVGAPGAPGTFQVAKEETGTVSKVVAPGQSKPLAQTITPADLPSKTKVAMYVPQTPTTTPTSLPSGDNATNPEVTYVRDKQGRITALRG